jgi:uncharacterized protein (TIGR02246 family)
MPLATPALPKSWFADQSACIRFAERLKFFMLKFSVFPLTGLLLLAGCNSAPPPAAPAVDVAAEQAKIRDIESAWVQEAAAKDFEKAAGHYTDDAVLIISGGPPARGKEAVHAAWKALLEDPNVKLAFSADRVELSASGDMATTKGSYTMTVTNPKTKKPVEDKGSYLTVYKKQADGNWKVIEDMTASEIAPK